MLREDDNILESFGPHENEEVILKKLIIKRDYKILISKNSDTKSYIKDNLSRRTS